MKDMRKDPLWDELYQNLLKLGKTEGQQTGGAAPVDVQEHWDKNGRIYQTDKNGNKIFSTSNYIEKIGNKAKAVGTNVSNWINESNPDHKSYKEKANLIGALSTLPYGAGTAIAKSVTSKLTPHVGRKIAQSVADGLSGGAIAGTVEGALRSYQENQNPLKTIPQDAVTGAVSGLGLGALGSSIQKVIRGQILKNTMDPNIAKGKAQGFYNDYLKGTNVKLSGSDQIQFSNAGLKKSLSNSADVRTSQSIPDLPKLIKNGDVEGGLYPNKNNAKFDKYHYITNSDYNINKNPYPNRITIGENANGKFFYNINDIEYPSALQNENSIPLPSEQILGGIESNSIIPENLRALKSFSDWLEELKRQRGHK